MKKNISFDFYQNNIALIRKNFNSNQSNTNTISNNTIYKEDNEQIF